MNTTTTTTAVETKRENPLVSLNEQLEQRVDQFRAALPAHIPVERFKRVLLTAVQMNGALAIADRKSFFNSAMRSAQDGLLPDGREGAMVIYKTKMPVNGIEQWVDAVQWMPMIAGIRKKVRNSGEIATWDTEVVFAKDHFEYELGDSPFIKHKRSMDADPGSVVAAYSVCTLKTGEKTREVMTVSQIEKVRARSKATKNGPWFTDYEEMCRKTVARRHSKVLPMSTDLDDLIRRDDNLYDIDGASDKAVEQKRPQLSDFTSIQPAEPTPVEQVVVEQSKARDTGTSGSTTTAAPEPAADPETGEIRGENPMPEFAHADAYKLGELRCNEGKMLLPIPSDLDQKFHAAYTDGFKAAYAATRGTVVSSS